MRLLLVVTLLGVTGSVFADSYDCLPRIKYECNEQKCERITEGFQHAESFSFDAKRSEISACLWTACYSGKATTFRNPSSGELTAISLAKPEYSMAKPIVISITIDKGKNFTAIWSYGGRGLTFDVGKCSAK